MPEQEKALADEEKLANDIAALFDEEEKAEEAPASGETGEATGEEAKGEEKKSLDAIDIEGERVSLDTLRDAYKRSKGSDERVREIEEIRQRQQEYEYALREMRDQKRQAAEEPDLSKLTPEQRQIYRLSRNVEELKSAAQRAENAAHVTAIVSEINREIDGRETLRRTPKYRELSDRLIRSALASDPRLDAASAARGVETVLSEIERHAVASYVEKAKQRARQKTSGAQGGASGVQKPKQFNRKDWRAGGPVEKSLGDAIARMIGGS